MYELMILGQLARLPRHGYGIAKVIDYIIGPFRKVQWGALYPVLNRLEAEGLITSEESGDGGRARHVYSITDAGRQRLRELLLDTGKHQGEYDFCFAHKVSLFSLLTREERLHLARHYWVFAQQNIDHLRQKRDDFVARTTGVLAPDDAANILQVIDHRIRYWQAEQAFASDLIAQNSLEEVLHGTS